METNANLSSDEPAGHKANKFAQYLTAIVRFLMGALFLLFGLNGFLHFLPQPKTMPEGSMAFAGALMSTHYMFPLIMGTQLLVGVLLLLNLFVPLALALIAPVIVNIIAFHIFLDPAGIGPGLVVLAMEIYLAWAYRKAYRPMLAMRFKPD